MCEHCEHVWIAVSCSVKLFPNLEAAGLGVFNRVLKFFRKTSTSFHRRVGWREKNARHSCASFQTHPLTQGQGSLMLTQGSLMPNGTFDIPYSPLGRRDHWAIGQRGYSFPTACNGYARGARAKAPAVIRSRVQCRTLFQSIDARLAE